MQLPDYVPLIVAQIETVEADGALLVELKHLADIVQGLMEHDGTLEDLNHGIPPGLDRVNENVAGDGGLLVACAVSELLTDARTMPDAPRELRNLPQKD